MKHLENQTSLGRQPREGNLHFSKCGALEVVEAAQRGCFSINTKTGSALQRIGIFKTGPCYHPNPLSELLWVIVVSVTNPYIALSCYDLLSPNSCLWLCWERPLCMCVPIFSRGVAYLV